MISQHYLSGSLLLCPHGDHRQRKFSRLGPRRRRLWGSWRRWWAYRHRRRGIRSAKETQATQKHWGFVEGNAAGWDGICQELDKKTLPWPFFVSLAALSGELMIALSRPFPHVLILLDGKTDYEIIWCGYWMHLDASCWFKRPVRSCEY